jgi:hypothetical protein
VKLGRITAQQRHAVLTTGHEQCVEVMLLQQPGALPDQRFLILTGPGDHFELCHVGCNRRGTMVAAEVLCLGVDQHRLAGGTRQRDHFLDLSQGTLAVVRQNHDIAMLKPLAVAFQYSCRISGREAVLEIQPNELLVTTYDPQLGDGGNTRNFQKLAINARAGKQCLE